jgi:hypothetical protein
MIDGSDVEIQMKEPMPRRFVLGERAVRRYRLVSWLFAREAVDEVIATRVRFNAGPETVWSHIVLFEEILEAAPLLLRTFLPHPIRTEGEKTQVGTTVRCTYEGGYLIKRITIVEPPRLLQFEVVEQHLGIEGCAVTLEGCYKIQPCDDGTDVELVTKYLAHLRPRSIWHPFEALLVGQLHRHILRGVRAAILGRSRAVRHGIAESVELQSAASGGVAWKISPSCSHR